MLTHQKQKGLTKCRKLAVFMELSSKMFFKPKEHEPSHLHALYGEYVGIFNSAKQEMIEGDLPKRAQDLVREWMEQNQQELLEMWDTQNLRKLPPL